MRSVETAQDRFVMLCIENGIELVNNHKGKVKLSNGAIALFLGKLSSGTDADIFIFDEFAFSNIGEETIAGLMTSSKKVIISSTPMKGSLFNQIAINALNGKNGCATCVVHWSMNSHYMTREIQATPYTIEGGLRFDFTPAHISSMISDRLTYMQEMECALLT